LLAHFSHCLYLSEAAPTIFVLNDWLVNADSYRQQTIVKRMTEVFLK
jgi:hypothetical protein